MTRRIPKSIRHLVHREPNQFTISTFSTGGKGGQNQNHRNMGVRITDTVTGLSSEGREFRSQLENRKAAFEKLVDLIIAHALKSIHMEQTTNDEVIKTYDYKLNRVTDHRDNTDYDLGVTMKGKKGGATGWQPI